ncbi:MAG: energy-coupling factor ABC transporter ATP-binding protein [Desulfobacteraceae bacterium]|nr:energy-coupling factor ABC transporter ATP-binding protein [Desulfobacteraceae bacterium]
MKMTHSYKLNHIQHYYGDKKVLDIDTLEIPRGSITGLTGPNGSGKSTLLKIMAFALKPSAGEVWFNGRQEFIMSPRVRSRVTLLTQKPYLLKRSVFDNIAYGLKIRKEMDKIEDRIKDALESVGLKYGEFAQRQWHELSGGEAQRVAMAARLILRPEVLLLDEPVASVDTKSAGQIRKASLAAREDWGCTIIIASHDLPWLYECSDTRISIANGKIFSTGRENIIPPPYDMSQKDAPVKWLGKNEKGEYICLPPKGKNQGIAVIQKEKVRICLEKEKENSDNQITGKIISMLMEKSCGHIMTTIQAKDFSLNLSFSPDQAEALKLLPGKKIILMFRSQDIEWR